ncbi:response regulator transcription factor [Pedobacter sp. AW31-3R]|uniref:response regulator transcription factor n=1 Tax=Pedobacter sp. AW31-3R TaxID=3445781 RepID=UPI003F9F0A3D
MKVLNIEDEMELANSIIAYLSTENYSCELAATFAQAMQKVNTYNYDCILLDISLPDGNGLKVLEELMLKDKQDGVIIISAKDSIDDRIKGLQIGADDYLVKPFHLSELAARVFSLIRRKKFGNANIIRQGELEINLPAKTVSIDSRQVILTKKEFDLLLYFIGNRNRVLSKSTLAEHLSGDLADMLDNHDFVYAHVKNLKRKLTEAGNGQYIKTVYGTGYKWEG